MKSEDKKDTLYYLWVFGFFAFIVSAGRLGVDPAKATAAFFGGSGVATVAVLYAPDGSKRKLQAERDERIELLTERVQDLEAIVAIEEVKTDLDQPKLKWLP